MMKFALINGKFMKVWALENRLVLKNMQDHVAFLNGLLTNDVRAMTDMSVSYNLWLKTNGNIRSDFYLYRIGEAFYLFGEFDHSLKEEFLKLKMSLKVAFEVLDWELAFIKDADFDFESKVMDGLYIFKNNIRFGVEGYDVFGPKESLRDFLKGEEISKEELELIRIENLIPAVGKELIEKISPVEACMIPRAISLTKGCYVGQEAIARVYYRGKPQRVLAKLTSRGLKAGQKILNGSSEVGFVTSAVNDIGLGFILRKAINQELKTDSGELIRIEKLCDDRGVS
ncbi:MAG: folate-binding protein [Aquificaceae bacterium]|nr:folate-binding protein [Aquificaceae bacterium]MDW8237250.1 folate-binding protein [Aquificaceae bacterium]